MPSTVPAALTYLVAAFDGALSNVRVFYGPPLSSDDDTDYLSIGYGANQDTEAAAGTIDWGQFGAHKYAESYELLCLLMTQGGDTDLLGLTSRAYANRDLIAGAVAADKTLGGAVTVAKVASWRQLGEQDTSGGAVGLEIRIGVLAQEVTA